MLSFLVYLLTLAAAVLGCEVNTELLFVSLWLQINSTVSIFHSPHCRITRAKQHIWNLALIMPNLNFGCHAAASLSFWVFGENKAENVVMQKLLQYLLCSSTVSIELQLEMHGKVLWGVALGPWYL